MNTTDLDIKTDRDAVTNAELKTSIDTLATRIGTMEESHSKTIEQNALGDVLDGVKAELSALAESAKTFESDANWKGPVDAMTERIDGFESSLAMRENSGPEAVKTIGSEIFGSEQFKTYAPMQANGKPNAPQGGQFGEVIPFKTALTDPRSFKANLTTTELQTFETQYRPGIFSASLEAMNIGARIMRQFAPGAITWNTRRETEMSLTGYATSTLADALTGGTTPVNVCELGSVDGFIEGVFVKFWNSDGDLLKRLQVVTIDPVALTLTFATGAIDFDADAGWRITSEFYGATAEAGVKPFGFAGVQMDTEALKTLATMMAVSTQVLSSQPSIQSWIENKLRMRAMRDLSWHLLKGDGAQPNQLDGFDNFTDAQTYAWSAGEVGDNRFDAVVRAFAMMPWTGELVCVLNKLDLIKMMLIKGSDGHYINSAMLGQMQVISVGGRLFLGPFELVMDDACVEGDFYSVNMSEASELVDAQTAGLSWGYIDDQFARNMITARYEERLLHSIHTARAFVNGDWDNAPT